MNFKVTELYDIFSNRELSTVIWILPIILGIQFNKGIRMASRGVLKSFFVTSILIVILLAILYSSSIIYLLYRLSFWDFSLFKDSIYWFIGSGFLILFNLKKAGKEKDFFKNMVRDNLKLILILEFVVNIHQFSLITELILLPIIAFLAMIQAVAEREERTQKVKSLIDWVFTIFGVVVLGISIRDIWIDFHGFANLPNLKSFLLPIILSITFIPFAYCIAFYMNLELIFVRLGMFLKNNKDIRYAKRQTILMSRLSLKKLNKISPKINTLYNGSTREDIRNAIT
ncbi:hypothetical protein N6H18_16450 [Reichenbachiella agarivorans]|uniref:Uncharacterized protein n=1 Tax=Reichenbachiella agarivorans TaxID=2979464 RepID=A0ABY6CN46_9BACT|nr:hypothetical protein [Reichenbachiella agarivorans]UXP31937.1 hypothetical protein N6H18_16450 [Reichenbachiella agarivorans]